MLTESQIRCKIRSQVRTAILRHRISEKKDPDVLSKSATDHRYVPATSEKMFLDRIGSESEYEPKYLKKLRDYYRKMGLMSEATLPLRRDMYGGIESALMRSKFYREGNEETASDDSSFLGVKEQTDAAQAAERALDSFFIESGVPIDVEIVSIDETSMKKRDRSKLQNSQNPDRFVVSAQMAMIDEGEDIHRGVLLLFAVVAEEGFDTNEINPNRMISDISSVIRHELVHDRQYDSLARDMGISRLEAKNKFQEWGLIPDEDASRDKYLGSHIELDAFGHEFAERLAKNLGIKDAEDLIISGNLSALKRAARNVGLGENFREYFEEYPEEKFTKKLLKKIKRNLAAFKLEGIYP